jgi:hypothetical protein
MLTVESIAVWVSARRAVTGFHREVPLAEGRGRRPVMMEDSKGTVTMTPGRATAGHRDRAS